MTSASNLSILSLLLASSLVLISILFSLKQGLKLERDIIISILRAIIQLSLVGYLLDYIFGLESLVAVIALLAFMVLNAAYNASKRGGIDDSLPISFMAIALGTSVTLAILVLTGSLKFESYQIIPVGGMIISNSMVALGLSYKKLQGDFKEKREEITAKLALGSDIYRASEDIIKESIRQGMVPTIDSAKTLGIVTLPGMMTGLILGGKAPLEAIKYQLMVTFMLLSTTSIASYIAVYLAYRKFYNKRKQLKDLA